MIGLVRKMVLPILIAAAFMSGGCLDQPRMRMGCLPTSTPGGNFANPEKLGKHSYGYENILSEADGIVYTCRAGHVDLTHLRWNADYTRYLVNRTKSTLMKNGKGYSFNVVFEPSTHQISFKYPDNWKDMSKAEKEKIADEIAFSAGPYIAFAATTWHEMLTWAGTHFFVIEPEANSAFSWEDNYSNLLGTHLAVKAMRDTERSYNDAMQILIDEQLEMLGVQPRSVALSSAEKMRGKWFHGNLAVETTMKNFDIGLDGTISPTIIPDVEGCSQPPILYETFSLDVLDKYGVEMTYRIHPNVMEATKFYKMVGEKEIYPVKHYPIIIEKMKEEATERGYNYDS